jgi:hypothetical protein
MKKILLLALLESIIILIVSLLFYAIFGFSDIVYGFILGANFGILGHLCLLGVASLITPDTHKHARSFAGLFQLLILIPLIGLLISAFLSSVFNILATLVGILVMKIVCLISIKLD